VKNSDQQHVRLPAGAELRSFPTHRDERGEVGEFFRVNWVPEIEFMQWCTLKSRRDALRGMSVHLQHTDYLVLLQGHMFVGLRDLRPGSPTEDLVAEVDISEQDGLSVVIVPPGVAHGFYFHEDSVCALGTNQYYDPKDELGCHWADPELGIRWPHPDPIVCERDAALGPVRKLKSAIPPYPASE